MNIDDDCTVVTDMPLSDEVADFIEEGLHRDMSKEDVEDWCDQNLENVVAIYEKYRGYILVIWTGGHDSLFCTDGL